MRKKILIFLMLLTMVACLLAIGVSAKEAYVEKVPSNLVSEGEALEYFIVLDGEEYFNAGGATLESLNAENIASALDALVAKGEYKDAVTALGTKYMLKLVFPGSVNGTQITHVYMNNNGFKTNSYFSKYCGAIVYAPTHKTTGDANDHSGNIRSIDFGENSQITQIPLCYMNKAGNLRELKNFPKYLTSIEESAFAHCERLEGVLYINAVTIKKKAFDNGIVNVDGIIIGKDTVNIATEAFSTLEKKNGSKNVKLIEFQGDVTKMNIVASANNQGAFYFAGGTQRNQYSGLTCLVLSHPDNQSLIKEGTTFQSFLPNVYFNEASKSEGNIVIKGHNYKEAFSYTSYLECGTKSGVCMDCGFVNEGTAINPIFTCLGYSTPEDGRGGIVIGFIVDNEALKAYKENTGKTLEFGVFAIAQKNLAGDVLNSDGSATQGAIKAEISSRGVGSFELVITGFTTDAQKSANLAMGAYVIATKGDEMEISYLQKGTPLNGESYSFISYNEIN